jgi:hypothetical protein
MPTLAISAIYCLWHFQAQTVRRRRERLLRDRVAYLLWVTAHQVR